MQTLELDMTQWDCPYIKTTWDHDVTFHTTHWEFYRDSRTLESRMMIEGETEDDLSGGLRELRRMDNLREVDLLARKGRAGMLRSKIDETKAMHTILQNNGYVTGPFVISSGSEIWNVGFDNDGDADDALAELEADHEFSVESQSSVDVVDYHEIMQNLEALRNLLDGLEALTDTERRTLETAVAHGYFETPREATLDTLANTFDISKNGVSKNLRRSQRKVLDQVVYLMRNMEEGPVFRTTSSFDEVADAINDD